MKLIGLISEIDVNIIENVLSRYLDGLQKKQKIYYMKEAFSKTLIDEDSNYEVVYSFDYFESQDFINKNKDVDYIFIKIHPAYLRDYLDQLSINSLDFLLHDSLSIDFQLLLENKIQNEKLCFLDLNLIESNIYFTIKHRRNVKNRNLILLGKKQLEIKTNLITRNQINSLDYSAKILKILGIFKYQKFKVTIKKIKISNTKELIDRRGKYIIFDKLTNNIDQSIKEIIEGIDPISYKILICSEHANKEISTMNNYDYRVLMRSRGIYLSNKDIEYAKLFVKRFLEGRGDNLRIINQDKKSIKKIINNLKHKEVLMIFTKNDEEYQKIKGEL